MPSRLLDDSAFKPFPFGSLTVTYLAALLIIAGLSIASHFAMSRVLRDSENIAGVVNMAGRQRMLSQRIASLIAQRRLGEPGLEADLEVALATFEQAHRQLSAPYAEGGTNAGSDALHRLYFTGPMPLDAMVAAFVGEARTVLASPPGDPAVQTAVQHLFAAARSPMLDALNTVTSIQQQEGERRIEHLQWLETAMLLAVLTTLVIEALVIFRPMIKRISKQLAAILQLATTDALTGLPNRRKFLEQGRTEWARAVRYGGPLSVLMLDVDRFKRVNDTLGHAAGDAVLRAIAQTLQGSVRGQDALGRLGGEEFAVVLPHTDLAVATALADRIRAQVADTPMWANGESHLVTVSIGVATVAGPAETLEDTLRRADALLYEAKAAGRNRVAVER